MSLFDKILGGIGHERKSLRELEALLTLGARTASGIVATPINAMKSPAVLAATRIRCETIGSLSLKLYQRDGDAKKPATDHPLFKLIHSRPNPWTSSSAFVMALERDCITHGAGFALAVRAGDKIMELHRLKPESVTVDNDNLEPRYSVQQKTGTPKIYGWRDILHVETPGGLSPIKECAESIGLALALEAHMARILGNGGRPSGILKMKGKLNDASLKRLKASWQAAHSGEASGNTAILEESTEFEALTYKITDMEYSAIRAFQILEIARALGVPPNLLFDFSRATWSNAEEASQSYLTYGLLPRTIIFQDAIGRLLSEDEQDKYFAEFNVDSLVKADISQRFSAYAQAIASRILNPNECRAYENLPPYAGGDEFLNPNISTPIPPPMQRPQPRAVAT